MSVSKQELRQGLKQQRAALTKAERAQAEQRINQHLIECLVESLSPNNTIFNSTSVKTLRILAGYWPVNGEPDCRPAYDAWRAAGHTVLLPVVEQKQAPLVFREWRGEVLTQCDAAGVPAPLHGQAMLPDTVLLPCLGFNPQGYRLGYGGGYYDRTAALLPQAYWLGVAFSWQAVEFAADPHDLRMTQLVTENGVVL